VLRRRKLVQSRDDLMMAGKVAMLAFSDQDVPETPMQANATAVTEILSVNSVPLAYLQGKGSTIPLPLRTWAELSREVQRHREKYDQWKTAFSAVRDLFLSNGVDYVFIKSPSLFPYTSGNLDIMVREHDFAGAGHLLQQAGFVELKNIREPHKYLYKRFECGEEVIAIHLHSRIFWGATFVDPDSPWSRTNGRVPFDDVVFSLSPEDCLLTTLAHSFYENSAITLFDLCVVKHVIDNEKVEWPYLHSTAAHAHWEDGFHLSVLAYERLHQVIFGGHLLPRDTLQSAREFAGRHLLLRRAEDRVEHAAVTMPFYLPLVTSKFLGYKKVAQSREFGGIHRRLGNVAKLMTEVLFIHILKVNPQKGMLIALSGVDGGGKTSYAHALMEALRNCGLDAHYVWTRVGSQKGLQSLAKRWARRSIGPGNPAGSLAASERFQKTRALLSQGWRYTAWKTVNLVDLCIFYNLTLRLKLLRRRIVVCDRYVPDMFVDLHLYGQGRPRLIWLKLLRSILPRPAVSILLTVPEETASRRSSDPECLDSLRMQAQLYAQTQEPLKLTVVDNGYREYRDVCNELVSRVLGRYYGRKCVWFGWDQDK
jgi:thymidylate kinase